GAMMAEELAAAGHLVARLGHLRGRGGTGRARARARCHQRQSGACKGSERHPYLECPREERLPVTGFRAYAPMGMGPPTVATPSAALPQSLRDEEVVRRVCAGETALFEILMRRYNARLFRVARAVLRNDSEAEDVVQQAYLSAYANMSQFAGRASFATWLTRIALNEAVSRSRRRVRLGEVETAVPDLPARAQPTPEDDASRHELGGLVEAAIDDLPDIYRVVLGMRAVQELDTAETPEGPRRPRGAGKGPPTPAAAPPRPSLGQPRPSAVLDAFPFGGARCDRIVAGVLAEISQPTPPPPPAPPPG